MKTRFISEVKKHLLILCAGFLYYIWISASDIYIPCIFKEITGFKCPGCGISHMLMAAVKLDFTAAFSYNPFLFITLPVMFIIYIYNRIYYIKNGTVRKRGKFRVLLEIFMLLSMVAFFLVRNIYKI